MKFSYLFLDACVVVRFGLGVKSLRSDHMVFGGKKIAAKKCVRCTRREKAVHNLYAQIRRNDSLNVGLKLFELLLLERCLLNVDSYYMICLMLKSKANL